MTLNKTQSVDILDHTPPQLGPTLYYVSVSRLAAAGLRCLAVQSDGRSDVSEWRVLDIILYYYCRA